MKELRLVLGILKYNLYKRWFRNSYETLADRAYLRAKCDAFERTMHMRSLTNTKW